LNPKFYLCEIVVVLLYGDRVAPIIQVMKSAIDFKTGFGSTISFIGGSGVGSD
jgi:hypothetical protein